MQDSFETNPGCPLDSVQASVLGEDSGLQIEQRVHTRGDTRRMGSVKYIGPVEGYSGIWVGVDWDDGNGKHDGTINGVRYFVSNGKMSGSFVRPQNWQGAYLFFMPSIADLKELDLTGNLLTKWQDVTSICEELPALEFLNLTNDSMEHGITELPLLKNIRILVLNGCGITWQQVEMLEQSLPAMEELHLMANKLKTHSHLKFPFVFS